jgi:hypothetical protein
MQSFKSKTMITVKKNLTKALVIAVTAILPAVGFGQPPGPGDAGGGGNPDGVPFDTNLNLIFLAVGLLFAGFILARQLKKRKATA